jgi:hypothetical protein
MELIVAVVILALLGVLSLRFGHDSRDGAHSQEHDLARIGLVWDAPPARDRHAEATVTPPLLGDVNAGLAPFDQPAAAPPKAA